MGLVLPNYAKSQEVSTSVPAPITEQVWTTPELQSLARAKANEYGINADRFVEVVSCETGNTWDPTIQSGAYNKRDGGRELSFGLVQIHLPDHPDITKAQAEDPEFALDWAAKVWSKGGEHQWSCYDM